MSAGTRGHAPHSQHAAVRWNGGVRPAHAISALLVCLAAPAWFVLESLWLGAALAAAGLICAALIGRQQSAAHVDLDSASTPGRSAAPSDHTEAAERSPGAQSPAAQSLAGQPPAALRPPSLTRDLSLIVIGLAIVRTIPLAAELDNWAMVRFTLALGGAVLVPYLVSRYLYRDRATGFPWRGGGPWGRLHWSWLVGVVALAWLLLPVYFMGSGVYQNWPNVDSPELIARLFVGVGAVGIWDELFFICTVFTVLLRHFPMWAANSLQAIVFVSFLWELGYRSWGPLLTIPFALVQGFIFMRTRSLAYVVTVHLIFDAIVFAVLVHAHNPALFDWFPLAR